MSTIALSHKGAKLMTLCDREGFKSLNALLKASVTDSICPAICMTEGCDHTTEMESDQDAGYCEVYGEQIRPGGCAAKYAFFIDLLK